MSAASTLAGWRRSGVGTAARLAIALLSGGAVVGPALAQDEPIVSSTAVRPYAFHVADAARRFGIPETWIWAVMRVESRSVVHAVSPAGAIGLMQIMPATWTELRARYGLGADPFDPHDNIMAGAAYLRELHDRYGSTSAMLAAYNAGAGRYDDFVSRGRPLPAETIGYLTQLAPIIGDTDANAPAMSVPPDPFAWRRAALFVRTAGAASDTAVVHPGGTPDASRTQHVRIADAAMSSAAASQELPADTLFVPRADAGRPQ